MSNILRQLFLIFLLALPGFAESPIASECQQLVVVVSPDWKSTKAWLRCYDRNHDQWVENPQLSGPVQLGRTGLAWGLGEHAEPKVQGPTKMEGDGKAPAGVFSISQLWLRPGIRPPAEGGFRAQIIAADTVAVDDPKSRFYNCIVGRNQVGFMDWKSAETMDIPDYDRVLVVTHNLEKPVPGRGSCIFIHRWETSQTPTSGCTALQEDHLVKLINWLQPKAQPRIVQLPKSEATSWQRAGWIPPTGPNAE